MATPVLMPRQGNTVESCLILAWKKEPGDSVSEGDVLCEVETDKAVFEVTAPADGTLLARFFDEGSDVPVLTNIAVVGAEGEDVEEHRPGDASGAPAPVPAEDAAAETRTADPVAPAAIPQASGPGTTRRDGRRAVSPRARRIAEKAGLDPTTLEGSGPRGRVIERDVRAALDARPAAAATPARQAQVETVPVRGVRKLIAERMLTSLQTTAQLTLHGSADASALLRTRKRLKASREDLGLRGISINDLVHFAVVRTLTRHPEINAHLTDETIRRFGSVDLAFAVDTDRGLMVPVIRGADRLSLRELADGARRLASACQDGSVGPDDLQGATFTVTNLGSLGVERFTPVLNPPQVAILGVSSVKVEPIRADGEVVFQDRLGLSLTIDHRAVDGAPGARFLAAVAAAIADVDLLMAG